MYLDKLTINGYKNFGSEFQIQFNEGLNVLVGENGVGKSAIIDALRLLLFEDEYGRSGILDIDFFRPFDRDIKPATCIHISATFDNLTKEEMVAFLPWNSRENSASLTLQIDNRQNNQGRYRRTLWGGVSQASNFEWELLDTINCIYLPPLRDAEAKLQEGKSSRLARFLKNINRHELEKAKENETHLPIEEAVLSFNNELSGKDTISEANKLIQTSLKEAIGEVFGQDTSIQFSEMNFSRIVENLRLLFFPRLNPGTPAIFRSLEENSLGYNNLLYLATILAEFGNHNKNREFLKILLIEEPEAHLHPQLQTQLLKYLEKRAKQSGIQIIVTTHSPVLASAVSLSSIIHLSKTGNLSVATPLHQCGFSHKSKSEAFLSRWLDVTKSTLLFARGIILVEGIAEAMLIPELAKIVLKENNNQAIDGEERLPDTLEECGVSIINMNGKYFKHFMQLFCNLEGGEYLSIPILCAGITDNDPPQETKPTKEHLIEGQNEALRMVEVVANSPNCRLFVSELKTFEYDLAMEGGNLKLMIAVLLELIETEGEVRKYLENKQKQEIDWSTSGDEEKKEVAFYLLDHVKNKKGEFAQLLSENLGKKTTIFQVPNYIKCAVLWTCGGGDNNGTERV